VNGEWVAQTQIPAEWSSYGSIQIVSERTEEQLRALIADSGRTRSEMRKAADLYASFMDEARIERAGVAPMAREFSRIGCLGSHADVIRHFGYALLAGTSAPVDFYVAGHPLDPDTNILYLWQSGLGLPDRDYYLLQTPEMEKMRAEYRAHIERLAGLAGWPDADTIAATVFGIETRLAEAQWSSTQNRDRERIAGNRYMLAGAAAFAPDLDWKAYLDAAQFHVPGEFVIAQADYFRALGGIVRAVPVAQWQAYLRFRLLKAYAPYLNAAIVGEDFAFEGTARRGQPQIKARWKRGVRLANEALGELVGQAYVTRDFPPAAKARMDQLIASLRAAYGQWLALRASSGSSFPTRWRGAASSATGCFARSCSPTRTRPASTGCAACCRTCRSSTPRSA
jgi:endothelin-converting enzyme/putative endopeptidase